MIKSIFLHIGVHKTASSTIQDTLYSERLKLAGEGVLYPDFRVGNIGSSNHSIPLYSLFCQKPEKYHINVSNGFTTSDSIKKLHAEYRNQLARQVKNFRGETMVISGEDISHFSKSEFENLKSFLWEITCPEVKLTVVAVCRHPVFRFRSALQASICIFGVTMEKAILRHLAFPFLYRDLLGKVSEVFGRENISWLKYEDAITHPYGPAGALLELIDPNLPEKIKPVVMQQNRANNYENVVLLNAINQTYPQTIGFELHPERMVGLNVLFLEMPGQKFMLPKGMSRKVWEVLSEDVNWLCREFSLPEYQFLDIDVKPGTEIWSRQTLDYLQKTFPQLPSSHRKTVMLEFFRLIVKPGNHISPAIRKRILLFILSQSVSKLWNSNR